MPKVQFGLILPETGLTPARRHLARFTGSTTPAATLSFNLRRR